MYIIDIFIIIPLIWFTYKGFTKGLAVEVASLVAIVLGIYACFHFSKYIGGILGLKGSSNILAFIITFLIVVITVYILGNLLSKALDMIAMGFFNKLAGAIFGMLKMALILSLLIYFLNALDKKHSLVTDKMRSNAIFFKPIESLVPVLIPELIIIKEKTTEEKQVDKNKNATD